MLRCARCKRKNDGLQVPREQDQDNGGDTRYPENSFTGVPFYEVAILRPDRLLINPEKSGRQKEQAERQNCAHPFCSSVFTSIKINYTENAGGCQKSLPGISFARKTIAGEISDYPEKI